MYSDDQNSFFLKLNITRTNRDVIVNKKRKRRVKIRDELDG